MDLGQFTWTNLLAAIALLLTGSSMLFGVWWALELRIRSVEAAAEQRARAVEAASAEKRQAIEKQLTEFKLHVVEKYASWDTVEKIQKRVEDRIESMAYDVSKMPDVVVERIMKFLELQRG